MAVMCDCCEVLVAQKSYAHQGEVWLVCPNCEPLVEEIIGFEELEQRTAPSDPIIIID